MLCLERTWLPATRVKACCHAARLPHPLLTWCASAMACIFPNSCCKPKESTLNTWLRRCRAGRTARPEVRPSGLLRFTHCMPVFFWTLKTLNAMITSKSGNSARTVSLNSSTHLAMTRKAACRACARPWSPRSFACPFVKAISVPDSRSLTQWLVNPWSAKHCSC